MTPGFEGPFISARLNGTEHAQNWNLRQFSEVHFRSVESQRRERTLTTLTSCSHPRARVTEQ